MDASYLTVGLFFHSLTCSRKVLSHTQRALFSSYLASCACDVIGGTIQRNSFPDHFANSTVLRWRYPFANLSCCLSNGMLGLSISFKPTKDIKIKKKRIDLTLPEGRGGVFFLLHGHISSPRTASSIRFGRCAGLEAGDRNENSSPVFVFWTGYLFPDVEDSSFSCMSNADILQASLDHIVSKGERDPFSHQRPSL